MLSRTLSPRNHRVKDLDPTPFGSIDSYTGEQNHVVSIQDKQAFSGDAPIVEGAWPEQQPTRDGHRPLFFGLGEASAEVEGQDDEEWNIPGMEKDASVT